MVTCFQVGGLESTLVDFEVPKRYGLRQTIGDTLAPAASAARCGRSPCCPDALLLQYVNPMAML